MVAVGQVKYSASNPGATGSSQAQEERKEAKDAAEGRSLE